MMNYKHPSRESILVKPVKLDYERYMQRSKVSAVEASHLFIEVLPTIDSVFAFLNPRLQEAQEIFKLLIDAAENGKIKNIQNENGSFKAPLRDWSLFLMSIKHPLPSVLQKLIKKSEIDTKNEILNKTTPLQPKKLDTNEEKLCVALNYLDAHFPKIPHKYYFYHPEISKLIEGENHTEETFRILAADLITRVRIGGRPTKDMLNDYEKAHPEKKMQEWFAKIRSLRAGSQNSIG